MLGSASVLRPPQQASQQQQAPQAPQQQQQQQQANQQHVDGAVFGLDAKLQALAQLFELASTHTQVDHPLCMDCVGQLKDEMEAQVRRRGGCTGCQPSYLPTCLMHGLACWCCIIQRRYACGVVAHAARWAQARLEVPWSLRSPRLGRQRACRQ